MDRLTGRMRRRVSTRDVVFCLAGVLLSIIALLAVAGSVASEFSIAADVTPAGLAVAFCLLASSILLRTILLAPILAGLSLLCFAVIAGPETAALAAQTLSKPNATRVFTVIAANVRSDNLDRQPFLDLVRAKQPDVIVVAETYAVWTVAFEELRPHYRIAAGCALRHECDVVVLTRLASAPGQPPPLSSRVVADLILPAELGGDRIRVMGLHLSRSAPGAPAAADLEEAAAAARSLGALDIVAGDFNATPWGARLRRFDAAVDLERHTR